MACLDTPATLGPSVPREIRALLDLRVQLGSRAPVESRATRATGAFRARKATKVNMDLMDPRVTWA